MTNDGRPSPHRHCNHPANQIGDLLQALSGLAAHAVADQQHEIAERLVRPQKEAK
jgi:hypothetical protein